MNGGVATADSRIDPLDLPSAGLTRRQIVELAGRLVQAQNCDAFIAGRIGFLTVTDDIEGAGTWRAIAAMVRAIRDASAV